MSKEKAKNFPKGWKAYIIAKKRAGALITYMIDVRYPDGDRVRTEMGTTDRAEAQSIFERWFEKEFPVLVDEWQAHHSPDDKGPNPKLSEIFDYYTKKYLPIKNASASTIQHHEQVLRDFELYCRDKRVGRAHQLSRSIVDGHASELVTRGRKPKTVHNALATIRACLNAAVDAELLESSPIKKWLMPTLDDPDIQPLMPEELHRVLGMVTKHEPDVANIIHWMAHTGMRISDARELRWTQLDLRHRKRTRSQRKTGKRKTIAFSKAALAALMAEKSRAVKGDIVFTNPDGGPFSRNYVLRAWGRALKKGGFRHMRLHDLRHTFAYILINIAKCPLPAAMEALEHSNIKTTMKYCQTGPLDEHLAAFDKIVSTSTNSVAKRQTVKAL